jgi:hypothetical protein
MHVACGMDDRLAMQQPRMIEQFTRLITKDSKASYSFGQDSFSGSSACGFGVGV